MIDFTQLLREQAGTASRVVSTKPRIVERRSHPRIELRSIQGTLLYLGCRTPCRIVNLSVGGVSVETNLRFTAGALAQVEITATVLGQEYHFYGMTEWVRYEQRLGIRFTHPSMTIRSQIEGLVARLFDVAKEKGQDFVDGKDAESAKPEQSSGNTASAGQGSAAATAECVESNSPGFTRKIHGSACRALSWEEGEWPVEVRYPQDRLSFSGSIVDLSLVGCSIRTQKPFSGEFHTPVELSFRLRGLPFLVGGKPVAVDDPNTVGITFSPMASRRRDDLAQTILELRNAGKYQPKPSDDELGAEEEHPSVPLDSKRIESTVTQEELEMLAENVTSNREWVEQPLEPLEHESDDFWKDLKSDWDIEK